MNTNGHYDVTYWADGSRLGEVQALVCQHCDFFVKPIHYHRSGDRSGMGRYNRARAVMVKHLHAEHRAALTGVA